MPDITLQSNNVAEGEESILGDDQILTSQEQIDAIKQRARMSFLQHMFINPSNSELIEILKNSRASNDDQFN